MWLETVQKIFRILFDSFFFMGPLLNTRQPQISGQQNSQDFLDIIYTYRFYRRLFLMKIAEFPPRFLTLCLKFE